MRGMNSKFKKAIANSYSQDVYRAKNHNVTIFGDIWLAQFTSVTRDLMMYLRAHAHLVRIEAMNALRGY
jgi:hypothetical protein